MHRRALFARGICLLLALAGVAAVSAPRATRAARALGDYPDGAARPGALDPVPDPDEDGVLWFAATGHTLRGGFRAFWEQQGGLALFGYPLSEEFLEYVPAAGRSFTVQYFERNRFEWHPENAGTPGEFLLGLLGVDLTAGTVFPISPPFGSDAVHRYFPETQHSIGGAFLDYWNAHGGLAIFGYPISEEIEEQVGDNGRIYLVQYFQRNRFELHPEFRGTPNEIQLGRLGRNRLRQLGWLR